MSKISLLENQSMADFLTIYDTLLVRIVSLRMPCCGASIYDVHVYRLAVQTFDWEITFSKRQHELIEHVASLCTKKMTFT